MDFVLSEEDRDFAREMRRFFTTAIPNEIRERSARGEQPTREEVVTCQRIMNEHGLAVPHWPVEWGGREWTPIQRHLWAEEMTLAHVPPPIVFNTSMVGPVIATFGGPELCRRYLPATASAEIWWSQGFSEPNAGSDLASLRTTAVREGDTYVVNGQKTWTTLAQYSDWMFCLVRTDPAARKQRGISFLLLDLRSPGVTVRPIRLIDGGVEVNEVFFEDVRVPVEQLVGEENKGWSYAKFLLGNERTSNAGVGIIKSRVSRIKRLAGGSLDDPLLRARLTTLEVETVALEMSVLRVLDREGALSPGAPDPMSSMLKLRGTELQQRATELLVDVVGPMALAYREDEVTPAGFHPVPEGAVDALSTYFNWRKASIYAGSNEVQRGIISNTILSI